MWANAWWKRMREWASERTLNEERCVNRRRKCEKRDGAKDPNECQPQMCYKLFNYGSHTHTHTHTSTCGVSRRRVHLLAISNLLRHTHNVSIFRVEIVGFRRKVKPHGESERENNHIIQGTQNWQDRHCHSLQLTHFRNFWIA